MSIITPIITSIIKPIITNIVSVASSISRYFQSYNGTSSFGEFAAPITFTGDFTFSIDFTTTVDTNQILLGDDHTTSYYFNMSTTGFKIFYAGSSRTYTYGAATPFDGNLHNIKYKLTGTSLEVFLDEVSLGSQTIVPYTGANNFLLGDSNNTSIYFTGTLANLILVDDADGDELVTTYDDGYINTSSDSLTLAGGVPYRTTEWLPVEEGETYNIQRTNSTRRVWQYSTDNFTTATWGGQSIDDSFVAPTGATHIRVYYGHSSDVNPEISVRQVMSETLTFPLVESDIEYPNERDTTEHMTNGDFATDDLTGWTPSNATQSVVNNSLELVDAGGSAHTIHLLLVPHADTDYDISIDIKAAAGNTSPLAASVTLGGTVYRVSAEDTTETITATVSSSNFGYIEIKCATWGGSNGDTAYFSNISVLKASNYLTFTDVTLIELP